ncbi:autophagy protein Apg5-domain-containing protein, partial [Chytridium lagenaria]
RVFGNVAVRDVDAAVTRQIWRGKIAACFSLDAGDAAKGGVGARDPLYLLIPRIGYLPLLSPRIYHHFFGPIPEDPTSALESEPPALPDDLEVWYDAGGVPLRWHYPIGLLFDLHNTPSASQKQIPELPWEITVHISSFPADKIFRTVAVNGFDPPLDFFMAQLKETDFIRNGSTKRMMSLTKHDQMSLWNALRLNDHDAFWEVNAKLLGLASSSHAEDAAVPKSVAMRIYWGSRPIVQEMVAPIDGEGQEVLLGDTLRNLGVPWEECVEETSTSSPRDMRAITHGVKVLGSTPVLWISRNMSYADNFVHLVVVESGGGVAGEAGVEV